MVPWCVLLVSTVVTDSLRLDSTSFRPTKLTLVDDPVRSFKAKMASVISVRVVMMLIGSRRIFLIFSLGGCDLQKVPCFT